jgi:hypothetical protein
VDDVRDLLPPLHYEDDYGSTEDPDQKESRPDLNFVSLSGRKGLLFRLAEVKYRRHLRTARTPSEIERIRDQVKFSSLTMGKLVPERFGFVNLIWPLLIF